MAIKSKVNVGQLAAEIGRILAAYPKDIQDQINASAENIAAEAVNQLKKTSPKRPGIKGGRYSKGWTKTAESGFMGAKKLIIHNKDRYQLAHLLEKGHAKRGGGRVEGRPHIKPVEEKVIQEFIKQAEEAVKRGSS